MASATCVYFSQLVDHCHDIMSMILTLMVKFLIINVTWHMPQNRARDTLTHVTLNKRCTMVSSQVYISHMDCGQ